MLSARPFCFTWHQPWGHFPPVLAQAPLTQTTGFENNTRLGPPKSSTTTVKSFPRSSLTRIFKDFLSLKSDTEKKQLEKEGMGERRERERRGSRSPGQQEVPQPSPAAASPTSRGFLLNSQRLWVSGITSWRLWCRLEMMVERSLSRLQQSTQTPR